MNTMTVFLDKLEEWKSELNEFDRMTAPKPDPVVFKDDPVALAWASYRRFKDNGTRWVDLDDVTATPEDYEKSAEIRKYYADRIVISMLRSKTISEFRRKLYGVVTNALQLNKADIGLLHRLPYFYEEDLAIDRVVAQTQGLDQRQETERVVANFTVIERIFKTRKTGEYTQFWLKSDQHTAPFMLIIKNDNPYYRFVTQVLQQSVKLSGWAYTKYHSGHHRGLGFYQLGDIEMVG
jgi:hypothetical protein